MCDSPREPASVEAGLAMLDRALDALNAGDVASLPAAVQARALRLLERAEAKHTAARARILAAFAAQGGYENDGQGSARVWLKWQTRITSGAAAGGGGLDEAAGRSSGGGPGVSRGRHLAVVGAGVLRLE